MSAVTPEHLSAAAATHRQVVAALASAQASKAFALSLKPWERAHILDTASKMIAATLAHADGIGFDADGDELPGMDLDAYASARELALELSNAASNARSQRPPRKSR